MQPRLERHPQRDPDQHRDQRGRGEPQQCLHHQPRRILEIAQRRDRADDRGEDERRHQHFQQLHENLADRVQACAQRAVRPAEIAREQAERQPRQHPDCHLYAEPRPPRDEIRDHVA